MPCCIAHIERHGNIQKSVTFDFELLDSNDIATNVAIVFMGWTIEYTLQTS